MSDSTIQGLRKRIAEGDPQAKHALAAELKRSGKVEEAWNILREAGEIPWWHDEIILLQHIVGAGSLMRWDSAPFGMQLDFQIMNNMDDHVTVVLLRHKGKEKDDV